MKRKFWTLLLIIFILIQFKRINKENPPAIESEDFFSSVQAPAETKALIKTACYDCHSHTSTYPWYSNIAPVSWWLEGHIEEGRQHTNFSTWASMSTKEKEHMLHECAEVLEQKEMPMLPYMIMHNPSWIDETQRASLAEFFKGVSIN